MRGSAHKRMETFTLTVVISVLRTGKDQQAAHERAQAILTELETALRDSPQLTGHYTGGGQLVDAQFMGVTDDDPRANDQEREAYLECEVRVRART